MTETETEEMQLEAKEHRLRQSPEVKTRQGCLPPCAFRGSPADPLTLTSDFQPPDGDDSPLVGSPAERGALLQQP